MSLSLYGVPNGQREGQNIAALPVRLLTRAGAQVALQRCPILRAGKSDSTTRVNREGQFAPNPNHRSSTFLHEATNPIWSTFLGEATRILFWDREPHPVERLFG